MVGRLSESDVRLLLASASLLIAVDYALDNSPVVVSKLPDYIAARRPILALTARSSAMGRLFNDDGAGLTASYDSPEEVADRMRARLRCLAEAQPRGVAAKGLSKRLVHTRTASFRSLPAPSASLGAEGSHRAMTPHTPLH